MIVTHGPTILLRASVLNVVTLATAYRVQILARDIPPVGVMLPYMTMIMRQCIATGIVIIDTYLGDNLRRQSLRIRWPMHRARVKAQ